VSDWRQFLARSEFRFAARRLRRVPTFTGAVVLVLALGVGMTTAMFSLVNGILLAPLPYPEPDRLLRLTHTASSAGRETVDLSDAIVMLYQRETRAFDGVAAWRFDDGDLGPSEADEPAVRVHGARVTANFFDVLGVPPGPAPLGWSSSRTASGRNACTVTPTPSVGRSR
jgi:putative ABC transport system permease protein